MALSMHPINCFTDIVEIIYGGLPPTSVGEF
jgi:hypothetical protein